jgi:23S rRNA pseudouridine1911/1915/1917 synthase
VVPAFAARDRLDGFLMLHGEEPDRSRAEWQKLIDAELVHVNGKPAKSALRVQEGDLIEIAPVAVQVNLEAQDDVPFEVVYADASMIVVNKPAGVVVHPAPGNEDHTLVNGLLARFPELRDITGEQRPGIVHRLDKDTSGLMVIGRTAVATANLQRQMLARTTDKRYQLLVSGHISEQQGFIDAPIGRDAKNRQRMAVRPDGRKSQTRFFVIERYADYTLVEAQLLTGRTHQLRVHFAHIGRPIAGDQTYGNRQRDPVARQFLHAWKLRLRSPHDEEERQFEAPLPDDLLTALGKLRPHLETLRGNQA